MISAAHRRLVERLAPGPVTFSIEVTDVEAQALCDRIGAARGVFEDGAQALFRCPTPGLTRAVLERARDPIVLASVSRRGSAARTAQEAREFLTDAAPEESGGANQPLELFDDGSPALGRRSTLVQLTHDGGYRVAWEGAFEARYIDKQLDMNILFLCTGNTCRSPMAAAIARGLIGEEEFGGLRIRAHSAGIGAAEGAPAAPEAAEAVRRMGIEMGPHSSTFLTRDLISQADLVFGMTRSHVDAARSLDPSASARIMLLDPDGSDIPDPIGMSQQVYDQTAAAIGAAIRRRLAGIAASPGS
jgi:protein-tyrosine-phosphatase/tRNA A37 threonylcarbamoyladenosine synthetase subunit TsaC/SUA5/YrdC